MTAKPGLVVMA